MNKPAPRTVAVELSHEQIVLICADQTRLIESCTYHPNVHLDQDEPVAVLNWYRAGGRKSHAATMRRAKKDPELYFLDPAADLLEKMVPHLRPA